MYRKIVQNFCTKKYKKKIVKVKKIITKRDPNGSLEIIIY